MKSARRSSALLLAGTLAAGSLALTACGGSASSAVSSAAGAATSAAAAAIDQAQETEIGDALGNLDDASVKEKVCGQVKSNAQGLYDQVIAKVNEQKAGAGDALKTAVPLDKFTTFVESKCS